MNPIIVGLITASLVVLAYLLVVMCIEIAKVNAKNNSQNQKVNDQSNSISISSLIGIGVGNAIYQVTTRNPSNEGQRILTTKERVEAQDPVVILSVIGALIISIVGICAIAVINSKKSKKNHPTLEDIQRKYPKRKPVEIPTDGIYEDFSRELTPVEQVEGESIEVDEPSFNRLLELSHGNRDIAIGFILRNMVEGKSAQWACERAIQKIENHIPKREPTRTISVHLFQTLVRMVNGQDDVARRLIERILRDYPHRSPDWACEKAIADLERDRRI